MLGFGKLNAKCIRAACCFFLIVLSLNSARGDSLTIVINQATGKVYYRMTIGSSTSNFMTESASSASWDSMVTTPGAATPSVGNTNDYAQNGMSFATGGSTYSYGAFTSNLASSSEAGLIGTAANGSSVLNLFVLDGNPSGIFDYKVPTLNGSGVVTSGAGSYGYTNGFINNGVPNPSYNPGTGTPITQLGGLESDLENNAGFAGNGNKDNILNNAEHIFTAPIGVGLPGAGLISLALHLVHPRFRASGINFVETKNGSTDGVNVPATIDVELAPAPLPRGVAGLSGLLGLFAIGRYVMRRRSFQTA